LDLNRRDKSPSPMVKRGPAAKPKRKTREEKIEFDG
jgi:hypothetical protein